MRIREEILLAKGSLRLAAMHFVAVKREVRGKLGRRGSENRARLREAKENLYAASRELARCEALREDIWEEEEV